MSREIDIIRQIGQLLGETEALSDDAFYDPEQRLILTTDMLVEGRHFSLDYFSPEDLGWKAAAVNISDIAAMGGQLQYLLISLGLPDTTDARFIEGFYQGLKAITTALGGRVVGGDTVGAPQVVVNVTAVGHLPTNHTVGRRSQARPGDTIMTTGPHGLSRVGLARLSQKRADANDPTCQRHLRPAPRVAQGLHLSKTLSRYALMDTSDGLADGLLKIARASDVRMVVEADRLEIHPSVARYAEETGQSPLDIILYGGEDFELLATVPDPALLPDWQAIGRVEAGPAEAVVVNKEQETLLSLEKTYQHLKEQADED